MRATLLCLLMVAPACSLYGGDDTGCDPNGPPAQVINPSTLACETQASDDACSAGPTSTWGRCDSTCRTLDEPACLQTPGCRGAYDHDCFFGVGTCALLTPFLGCYPTDLNLDSVTGCAGLDAWSCSRHEQCVGTYRPTATGQAYARCIDEPVIGT
ncbi:MAG: hypothetical protein R3B06_11055 [Kofleriaceae bacterium]